MQQSLSLGVCSRVLDEKPGGDCDLVSALVTPTGWMLAEHISEQQVISQNVAISLKRIISNLDLPCLSLAQWGTEFDQLTSEPKYRGSLRAEFELQPLT